jgi:hypothetical protein
MGTKGSRGWFDCDRKAEDGEPRFVLLGRDRHAPLLLRIWALLRRREGEDEAVIAEALACAKEMDAWREGARPERQGPPDEKGPARSDHPKKERVA